MQYVVIGAGGTGGAIGGFLTRSGKEVTLIARGAHLAAMERDGLKFETLDGDFAVPVRACTMEDYHGRPDVVFVCVKGYSLEGVIPFLERIAGPDTVVIPVLNIFGTGGALQARLPGTVVTDGCIYIASEIKEPGTIRMSGRIFRVVFGLRRGTPRSVEEKVRPVLEQLRRDLEESGIAAVLSEQIEADAFEKFSFVSPMAAAGAYYGVTAEAMQRPGEERETYVALIGELDALSRAMGISLPADILKRNLAILDGLVPGATASMQRDLMAEHASEIDGLVFEVVRMGQRWNIPTPTYARIAEKFRET